MRVTPRCFLINAINATGPLTSALCNRYGPRVVTILGGLLASTGGVLMSLSPSIVFLILVNLVSGKTLIAAFIQNTSRDRLLKSQISAFPSREYSQVYRNVEKFILFLPIMKKVSPI